MTCKRCGGAGTITRLWNELPCMLCNDMLPGNSKTPVDRITGATRYAMNCRYDLMTPTQLRRLIDYLRGRLRFEIAAKGEGDE